MNQILTPRTETGHFCVWASSADRRSSLANTLLPAKTVPVWYSYVQYYDRPTEYTE